ncbi:hypothetical protein HHL19_15470 [Streptomyces sp. R302]|uniref:hypothetical protein n=1 Tax=unclassified Streptomyces TaxID=2593676 RepID=UPI00145D37EF|nr:MULTISPECIES: hypothetical protein [unclassified Streptomyces]NML51471.1 hypothetical protein [Streptomyces sp. R301]NML80049.1 hypothetical protein [Streptomyces sp. R302]
MRALGTRFFPRLDGCDLHIQPEEVDDFLAECEAVRPHLAALAEQGGYAPDYVGGGVLVW